MFRPRPGRRGGTGVRTHDKPIHRGGFSND
jgi:hypothetical protein